MPAPARPHDMAGQQDVEQLRVVGTSGIERIVVRRLGQLGDEARPAPRRHRPPTAALRRARSLVAASASAAATCAVEDLRKAYRAGDRKGGPAARSPLPAVDQLQRRRAGHLACSRQRSAQAGDAGCRPQTAQHPPLERADAPRGIAATGCRRRPAGASAPPAAAPVQLPRPPSERSGAGRPPAAFAPAAGRRKSSTAMPQRCSSAATRRASTRSGVTSAAVRSGVSRVCRMISAIVRASSSGVAVSITDKPSSASAVTGSAAAHASAARAGTSARLSRAPRAGAVPRDVRCRPGPDVARGRCPAGAATGPGRTADATARAGSRDRSARAISLARLHPTPRCRGRAAPPRLAAARRSPSAGRRWPACCRWSRRRSPASRRAARQAAACAASSAIAPVGRIDALLGFERCLPPLCDGPQRKSRVICQCRRTLPEPAVEVAEIERSV